MQPPLLPPYECSNGVKQRAHKVVEHEGGLFVLLASEPAE